MKMITTSLRKAILYSRKNTMLNVAIAVKVAVNIVRMGLILRRVLLLKKKASVPMC